MGIEAWASAAAALLGGERRNDSQERIADKANAFSAQQFATRYQTTTRDMEAAGLNPMLAYSQGGGSPPQGQQAQLQDTITPAVQSYQNAKIVSAQAANIEADTENKKAQADLIAGQAAQAWSSAGQAGAQTDLIRTTVDKVKQETANLQKENLNLEQQYSVLKATVSQLSALDYKLTQEGYNQAYIRDQLKAAIAKLNTETKINQLDIDAAAKFGNLGRDYKQVQPIIDLLRGVLRK